MIMHMNGFFAAHSDLDVDAPLYRIMPKKHLRRWTKGYTIKQPNMDCQPTEITALMRHRAVFS